MKWVEIISVRLSQNKDAPNVRDIYKSIIRPIAGKGAPMDADLYVNSRVENDWSIHIFRDSTKFPAEKTKLGLSVAEAFRAFGLVNHSIWKRE